jgi:hypothetical protein
MMATTAMAIEGAMATRRQQQWTARQQCNGNNGNGYGRRDGDSNGNGGVGWRKGNGDGRCDGDAMAKMAMRTQR